MTLIRQNPTQSSGTWGPAESASLKQGLDALGLATTGPRFAQLETYAGLLLKWNRTYNLLGATTAQSLIDSHLLDSLAILPALQRWLPAQKLPQANPMLLDIGSGAGLPGLALAIVMPDLPITLVEPIGKKAAFLRQAIAQCRLPLVTVLDGKVEDLDLAQDLKAARATPPQGPGEARDATPPPRLTPLTPHFICRAFASLERFATLCTPHATDGSLLFAMKASRVGDELAQLTDAVEVLAVEPLRTVERDVHRNLVVLRADLARAVANAQ